MLVVVYRTRSPSFTEYTVIDGTSTVGYPGKDFLRFFSLAGSKGGRSSHSGYEDKRTTAGTAWVWAPLICGAGPNHALLQPQCIVFWCTVTVTCVAT